MTQEQDVIDENAVTQCCRNCTEELPLSSYKRYPSQPGYYKICINCMRLETRYRYLKKLQDQQEAWLESNQIMCAGLTQEGLNKASGINANPAELQQIIEIWEMYLQIGGNPVLLKDHANRDSSITQSELQRARDLVTRKLQSKEE